MRTPHGDPITVTPGRVIGGRLGRWRSRPALALAYRGQVLLSNLADNEWVCHVPITDSVHDVAFAPDGSLADRLLAAAWGNGLEGMWLKQDVARQALE
ncbi:hypothetical protein [Nocardia asiatica]|uniref:hypothetical protein n=1 Tax=Nocardia asiatica TaxID=209252 RepID=UPI0024557866|nr:hypothetical protein [Nocardia asiatica]